MIDGFNSRLWYRAALLGCCVQKTDKCNQVYIYSLIQEKFDYYQTSRIISNVRKIQLTLSWASSIAVSVSMDRMAGESWAHFLVGTKIYLFTTISRLTLEPAQPPVQLVPKALSSCVKLMGCEVDYSPPSGVRGSYTSILHIVMVWCFIYLLSSVPKC